MTTDGLLKRAATLPFVAVKHGASDPLVTGLLLWALTRGPVSVRERLLQLFRSDVLTKDGAGRLAKIVRILKVLVAYGLVKRVNQALNALALNNWNWRSKGAAWNFGEGKDELVLVTGGSSGFGYEMVRGFAKKARVVVIDIVDLPKELAELPKVYFYKCDLSDLAGIVSCTSAIKNQHGNPTVLINNAGIATGLGNFVSDTRTESLEKIFKINLMSHFVLIRELLPGMLEARKGHIVTIASTASFLGAPGLVDYCCTKAGAMSLHEGLRAELLTKYPGDYRLRTTIVHPSWHSTGIVAPYEDRLKAAGLKFDPPSNVADAVIRQVQNDRSGKLIIPENVWHAQYARSTPLWVRDLKSGFLSNMFQ